MHPTIKSNRLNKKMHYLYALPVYILVVRPIAKDICKFFEQELINGHPKEEVVGLSIGGMPP